MNFECKKTIDYFVSVYVFVNFLLDNISKLILNFIYLSDLQYIFSENFNITSWFDVVQKRQEIQKQLFSSN